MEEFKDFLIPMIVALVTAGVTAIITIQIKYSSTKEEAYSNLKKLAGSTLYYGWVAYLFFALYLLVVSSEPLTRADVLRISVTTVCLALLLIVHFQKRILSIIKRQADLNQKKFELFEKHMQVFHLENNTKSNENSNK